MCETYYNELRRTLLPLYGEGEARAIAFLVLEEAFGIGRTDVYARKVRHFSEEEACRWQNILTRLSAGIPVQYVLGAATFCGRRFGVSSAVLIPRPETEQLVAMAASLSPCRALDAGTGSGCIAVSLALEAEACAVEAWDVSPEALSLAAANARSLGADVRFVRCDMLAEAEAVWNGDSADAAAYDVIVSNPPYVCESEAAEMSPHVLLHEPHLALFVPDADPQRFYCALARLALRRLRPGGSLLVEGNAAHVSATADLFRRSGLRDVRVHDDLYHRPRFVTAVR